MIKTLQPKAYGRTLLGTLLVLLVPLVAMQFSAEVNWTIADFLVAGVLLMGTGLLVQLIAQQSIRLAYKVAASGLAVAVLLFVWAELAVGLL